MGIFIFTDKPASIKDKGTFPKNAEILSMAALSKHSPDNNDISYIDAGGLEGAELKKILTQIKNKCKTSPWGVIDSKGSVKDIGALFFDGASDYLGAASLKSGIDLKRIAEAQKWRKKLAGITEDDSSSGEEGAKFLSSSIKLPSSSAFPGWKKMQPGMSMPFYLLYCSVEGKTSLDSRFNEKIVAAIHKRFIEFLQDNLDDSDSLLWMNSGRDCLFLVPPKQKCIELAIKACFNMLVSAPLFTLEYLDLTLPVNFIFALHYGTINYKPPGKTGTVVSDAINFVFHLGTKKAELGRLTLSGELPGVSVPKQIQDCFISSKDFEGRKIWQSKKFEYPKNWV
ncbi:MAG: hypothetical protein LBU88_09450 [Treponema sp.]|jgi:hypothetical protein|nr:hypothetical protein [Treponema sp.]